MISASHYIHANSFNSHLTNEDIFIPTLQLRKPRSPATFVRVPQVRSWHDKPRQSGFTVPTSNRYVLFRSVSKRKQRMAANIFRFTYIITNSNPYLYFVTQAIYVTSETDLWDKGLDALLNLDRVHSSASHNGCCACQTHRPSLVKSIYRRFLMCRALFSELLGVGEEVGKTVSSITESNQVVQMPRIPYLNDRNVN